jgi:uncharacterized protein YyaL (SSP411 family)
MIEVCLLTKTKVSWLPWNQESFKKAQDLDKPILLGISAVWCHWCHVMDETTYSDNEVGSLIENKFVPIRVDRDRRPDIDKRYNMGGWPSTVFLTPHGEVLTGGTYIPQQQMMFLLEHVSRLYQKNKANLKAEIESLEKKIQKPSTKYDADSEVTQSIIDNLTLDIASQYDNKHGGFGKAQKFPHSDALRFTLLQHHLREHKATLSIVKKTLIEMGSGGIYDKEEGGFFRYSTTRDWSVPHYEKMCEDNAKLLVNYLEAIQVTGEKTFRDTAKGILEYVDKQLADKEKGGFYGSQDADEVYYKLRLPERLKRTHPKIDQTIFVNWNAMMSSAYLLASAVLEEQTYEEFALLTVDQVLMKAFTSKNGIQHYINEGDNHFSGLLTDQAYMAKCLIDCYQSTSNRKYLDLAEGFTEFMLDKLWDVAGGFYDKPKGTDTFGALKRLDKPLEENSIAADAFLRLHHLTGKQEYLQIAKKTLEYFASHYQRYGIMGALYGLAIELYLQPMQVHVVGSMKDEKTRRFRSEILKTYNPLKVLETLDPIVDRDRLDELGYPTNGPPTAYICFKGSCKSVENPEKITKIVSEKIDGN